MGSNSYCPQSIDDTYVVYKNNLHSPTTSFHNSTQHTHLSSILIFLNAAVISINFHSLPRVLPSLTTCHWCSEIGRSQQNKNGKKVNASHDIKCLLVGTNGIFSSVQVGREDNPEREKVLEINENLSKEREQLISEIQKFSGHDPEEFQKKSDEIEVRLVHARKIRIY